jgi:sensor histidine kinase YesM
MPEDRAKELSESLNQIAHKEKSLGLHNIARRLNLNYGTRSGIEIQNHEGSGFEVILVIEQKKNDGEQGIYV